MNLLSLGKDPINPDQPTGADVRYEPEFEELQAEIDKLSSPSSSGGIDWQKVGEKSALILAEKSKDLLVASYLAVSQIHTGQIEGLSVGLTVMHDLVNEFWDTLFPPKKRMRGRLGAIEWWIEKTKSALKNIKPEPLADEKLKELSETLARIDSAFKEYLPDPPLLISIQRFIEAIPSLSEAKSTADPSSPTEENTGVEPPAAYDRSRPDAPSEPDTEPSRKTGKPASLSTVPEDIATEEDARKLIDMGFQKVDRAASFLLENNPMNPSAYRYRRIAVWSKVSVLPQHTGTKTQIPPPAPHFLQSLLKLREGGNWRALLESAEQKLSQFIFWIDLNRFVAEALINLGESYQEAHEAVCQETACFIHRLPGLDTLCFSNGMPFADPETQPWLKSIVLRADSTVMEQIQVTGFDRSEDGEDPMAETIEKAQLLAKKKKIIEAVTLIQEKLQNCYSQKKALLWRMVLCQLLLGSKNKGSSLPHLEQLLNDIEKYRLETWDPELALKGLKVVWTGFRSLSDKALEHNAAETLNRIAKLDPAEALRLNK